MKTILLQFENGTIDPNWVMAITMIVLGFLLTRILNRMEKKMEAHDEKISEHGERIAVVENDVDNLKNVK